MKRVIFALLPLVALIAIAEVGLRIGSAGEEPIAPFTLPGEAAGLLELDRDLFWRLRANVRGELQGALVATNSLGLRGGEVGPKAANELRVLSLGESTTFGNGVSVDETYSALLEAELARALEPRPVVVVNAGVPAYSSFQSLVYLRERGIALEPDWVLFYHEGNDRLPSYVRASDNTAIGMAQSDAGRHADRFRRVHRLLLDRSAIYRFARYQAALGRIDRFQRAEGEVRTAPWRAEVDGAPRSLRFPVRVPDDERRAVLEELYELAEASGFELLLFHPSYRESEPHECVLTQFAAARGVALLDAHPLLHGESADAGVPSRFIDSMHPTPAGHRRLAAAAARALLAAESIRVR